MAGYALVSGPPSGQAALHHRANLMKTFALQGDTLDAICARHYGRTEGVVETVLTANPGLAELGAVLPHGTAPSCPISRRRPPLRASTYGINHGKNQHLFSLLALCPAGLFRCHDAAGRRRLFRHVRRRRHCGCELVLPAPGDAVPHHARKQRGGYP
ncbi:hypothetical protein AUN00_09280 [Cronobacter sakazakii]|nr:hypothetical protein AUN00_09280 [Cronobacter sakazakii]